MNGLGHADGGLQDGTSNGSSRDALRKLLAQATVAEVSARYTKGELIGQGAQKKVYKAFDEELGLEVAWNEVAVAELAWTSEKDRDRIFSEIRVLKQLKHKNIITLHDWWFDPRIPSICFITELFTDGTLRQYRRKHRNVDLVVLKRWAWQILQGLVYLHGHNPPIIHRDLKSDNIFVNGSSGVVKIGDLGFATMRAGLSMAMSVIGTPEFMAPELYEESYDEKVDVYSFGLCMLELDTLEYPYAECKNAAQIYKKVVSGVPPAGLERVRCEELRGFISTCICHDPNKRPEARQLLKHPFFDCMRAAPAGGMGSCKSGVMLSAMVPPTIPTARASPSLDPHNGQPWPGGGGVHARLQPPLSLPSAAMAVATPVGAGAVLGPGVGPVHSGSSRLAQSTHAQQLSPPERAASASCASCGTVPYSPVGPTRSNTTVGLVGLQPHQGALAPAAVRGDMLFPSSISAALGTKPQGGRSVSPGIAASSMSAGSGSNCNGMGNAALGTQAGLSNLGADELYKHSMVGQYAAHRSPPPALSEERSLSGSGSGIALSVSPHGAGLDMVPSSPFFEATQHAGRASPSPYPQSHGQPERHTSLDLDESDILFASDRGAMASAHADDAESAERPLRGLRSMGSFSGASDVPAAGMPIPDAGGVRMSSWHGHGADGDEADGARDEDSGIFGTSAASSLRPDLSMRLNMNCRPTQEDGTLSFTLSFVNHSGLRKKVGFLYNLDEDHPVQIANEMVDNLSLKVEEAEFIAHMIQQQVENYPQGCGCELGNGQQLGLEQ